MAFRRLYDGYGRLLSLCGLIAGIAAFGLMLLIVANALMRKILNQPIEGTLEIAEAAMPVIVFGAIAFTQLRRGHIRVILVTRHLPSAPRHWLLVATFLTAAGFFAWATWATWGFAMASYRIDETAWGAIRFPIWPTKFVVSIGVGLLAVQFLLDGIRSILTGPVEEVGG
jgi:TRAP-type C4-dicarboxylate transport system permease small subunit